ncbi:hypothetical protein [Tuwongella immobilis]|uniref:Uncharacterized protein n=1 Tax=Tuwongella immobilis TaxID=692036 RepID=A0A6C2YKI6_9BACT|nr:hypothetical protein [Tuwongella immobilis]VIP01946.1 unnamed protein product [Tuwongella immobilis]VTR99926.1 unnamed protein product [Tuwongella immobilis]
MRIPRWNHWLRRLTTQNWLRPFRPHPRPIVRAAWNHPNRELPEPFARLIAPGDRGICLGGFVAGWLRPLAQRVGPTGQIIAVESEADPRAALRLLRSRFDLRQLAVAPSIPSDASANSREWNWLLIGASATIHRDGEGDAISQILESATRPAVWWQLPLGESRLQDFDSEWVQSFEQLGYAVYGSTPSGLVPWGPGVVADAVALLTLAHLARLPRESVRSLPLLPQLPDSLPRAA